MINKKSIKGKVIEGDLDGAIKMLLKLTEAYDSNMYNEMIMLSARFNSLEKEKRTGLIDDAVAKMNQNRISFSLTDLISKIPEKWMIQEETDGAKVGEESAIQTILFLAANPRDTKPLRLGEEVRKIEAGLERSKNREFFVLKQKWAVQISDLRQALLKEKPSIVHFSGHGSKSGKIYLEKPSGNNKEIDPRALANLFELFEKSIQCVILNACYSEYQAQEISEHIEYVIGMNERIPDKASIAFSEAFYDGIANGENIEFSFKLGKNAISFYDIDSSDIPVLIRKMQ